MIFVLHRIHCSPHDVAQNQRWLRAIVQSTRLIVAQSTWRLTLSLEQIQAWQVVCRWFTTRDVGRICVLTDMMACHAFVWLAAACQTLKWWWGRLVPIRSCCRVCCWCCCCSCCCCCCCCTHTQRSCILDTSVHAAMLKLGSNHATYAQTLFHMHNIMRVRTCPFMPQDACRAKRDWGGAGPRARGARRWYQTF